PDSMRGRAVRDPPQLPADAVGFSLERQHRPVAAEAAERVLVADLAVVAGGRPPTGFFLGGVETNGAHRRLPVTDVLLNQPRHERGRERPLGDAEVVAG